MEPQACCSQIWVSVEPTKTHVKAPGAKFFGCLYNADGVHPDPEKVNAIHVLPEPTNITELQEFLGMVTYLSPFILGLSTLTAPLCELLKKDRLHLELHLWCHLPACQGCHCQWHHPQVLQPLTSHNHTSWCLTSGPWCSACQQQQTNCLCQQSTHQNWMWLHQYRKIDACCCLWSWEIQNLCLWLILYHQIRPQAPGIHLPEEPGRHTSLAAAHAIAPPGLWLHHPLPPQ